MSPDTSGGRVHRVADRLLEGVRGAARWVRWLPDRLLHSRRRARARRRVREARLPGPVLFVCHGNICRSPYAEAVFRERAGGRVEAASAGLAGPDRPSPETAREVAAERGVDLTGHRSRLVTPASLRSAGLVAVMDPYQARALRSRYGFRDSLVLGDLDSEPVRRRPIRDPVFQSAEVFRAVYARIDRCVDGLADALGLPPQTGRRATGERGSRGDGAGGEGAEAGTRPGAARADGRA